MKNMVRYCVGRSPAVIAGIYLCLGAAAVPAADIALSATLTAVEPASLPRLLTGWLFVGLSTGVIYGVGIYHCRRVAQARSDLETTNQQLQVVSRVFRHNVRNDLNVVRGYTDLLDERIDDDRSQRYIRTIRETTDDVVDISEKLRIVESARPDPTTDAVDLVDIVRDVVDDVRDDEVVVSLDAPSEAWIRGGPSVSYPIREVFENAIAHNDKPTCRLEATVDVTDETTCLSVHDNGPGIPESERLVLQAEEETPLSHASSIGLWLIKWLCELQGGTVEFDTTNGGTVVRLRFQTASPEDRGNTAER